MACLGVADEIADLHRFFVGWYHGAIPADGGAFERDFAARLAPEFGMVVPSGGWLSRAAVVDWIAGAHASRPGHRIAIRDVRVRPFSGERLVVATYQEWFHREGDERGALQATLVLRPEGPGRAEGVAPLTPGGWHWLHVHETALAADIVAAGDFDF